MPLCLGFFCFRIGEVVSDTFLSRGHQSWGASIRTLHRFTPASSGVSSVEAAADVADRGEAVLIAVIG
jgi:hypothetical protein